MDLRNKFGLYGSYFLGMAGIGFTLPYLPLYLGQLVLNDRLFFWVLAGTGVVAPLIVATLVPETLRKHQEIDEQGAVDPMAVTSDLSTSL